MNIDKLLSNSFEKIDQCRKVSSDTYDEAWANIQKKKNSCSKGRKIDLHLSFKEFAVAAAFILLLVLVPTISSYYNNHNNSSKNDPIKETTGTTINNPSNIKPGEITTPKETTNTTSSNSELALYYPFIENIRLTYTGNGMEYASYKTTVDFINNNRIQLRVDNPGTTSIKVLEIKDGELRLMTSIGEAYYRDNLTTVQNANPEILLKEPLVKGTTWTVSDGKKRFISNKEVPISTPAGSFNCLEVTTEGKNFKELAYYSPNVGLIKTVYIGSDNFEITSTLSKIEKNTPFAQQIKFYYGDVVNDKLVYVTKNVIFKTNDITRKIFEDLFKEAPDKNLVTISKNTKINSLYLNSTEQMVYIDFSKELMTEMNAGTSKEMVILDSVTATLGNYYNVNKIYLTVEGKPYESGHIVKAKGEPFIVNFKNSQEYKK